MKKTLLLRLIFPLLFLVLIGGLIFLFFPRPASQLLDLPDQLEGCSLTVSGDRLLQADLSPEEAQQLLALLDDTKIQWSGLTDGTICYNLRDLTLSDQPPDELLFYLYFRGTDRSGENYHMAQLTYVGNGQTNGRFYLDVTNWLHFRLRCLESDQALYDFLCARLS